MKRKPLDKRKYTQEDETLQMVQRLLNDTRDMHLRMSELEIAHDEHRAKNHKKKGKK
jgi:hypothetical protein